MWYFYGKLSITCNIVSHAFLRNHSISCLQASINSWLWEQHKHALDVSYNDWDWVQVQVHYELSEPTATSHQSLKAIKHQFLSSDKETIFSHTTSVFIILDSYFSIVNWFAKCSHYTFNLQNPKIFLNFLTDSILVTLSLESRYWLEMNYSQPYQNKNYLQ